MSSHGHQGVERPATTLARTAVSAREAQGLLRHRNARTLAGAPGPHVTVGGRTLVNFASNGYLGLSTHPKVIAACAEETRRSGTSSTASRLVSGNLSATAELERTLAHLKGKEDALVFSSGYLANIGVLRALGSVLDPDRTKAPLFLSDAHNHASLIDGCRLARAEIEVYPHGDVRSVRTHLETARAQERRSVVLTESRFSMDGDVAPIEELARLADEYGATLVIDEAHATGIDGDGRGLVHALGLTGRVDIIVGTLGKALGAHGAFAAASSPLIRWLENTARSFVFTTGLPGPIAAAASAAVDVLCSERPDRALARNIAFLRAGLAHRMLIDLVLPSSSGPIVPIIVGEPARAVRLGEFLEARGILAATIRPPTVPDGTSRLRLSIRADHDRNDITQLLDALDAARRAQLFAPPSSAESAA